MKLTPRSGLLAVPGLLLGLALLLPPPARAAVDPFYESLLREGILLYDRGDFVPAARRLRLACFGMLDEPQALGACLGRLALAQDRAGDAEGFQDTFRRLADVEERFQGYTRSDLPQELRAALEQKLAALIPAATLQAVPAFRTLADRKPGPAARDAMDTREARERQRPGNGSTAKPSPPPTPAPQVETAAATIPAAAPLTAAERETMAQVRRLLAQEGKIKELRQAFELARGVADAHPQDAEAQHLAAEAAYRISRWEDAARYFRRGGEPGADQPELQFYMAVALFESGDAQSAAAILKRSLPNLQRTPYVDAYARKILG